MLCGQDRQGGVSLIPSSRKKKNPKRGGAARLGVDALGLGRGALLALALRGARQLPPRLLGQGPALPVDPGQGGVPEP